MFNQYIDSGSYSSDLQQEKPKRPQQIIYSILKHLPEARKIMEGHNYEHQVTKCLYNQPLANNPNFIATKTQNTQNAQLQNNRLVKLEDAEFQHEAMKQKIKNMLQNNKKTNDNVNTLWSRYSGLTPSYARFGANARKNNFANVLMPINGVNIVLSSKFTDKPVQTQNILFPRHLDSIRFDSHFESGNLLYAYRKQGQEIQTYDLILQNDINTKGHNQWFYFKVYNSKQHNKIKFNIINFIKDESMFSYGIKPLAFSERDYSRHRIGWVRNGQKVCYYENKIKRECNSNSYYTLTFQYYFRQVDTVYFAPIHPYTYTQLTQYFDNLMSQYSLANFISLKNVVQTVGGNSVSIVTVGTGKKLIKDCSVVWVLGRQHPGQTTSSFMVEGIINYLIGLYANPTAQMQEILDSLIFKIVPMVNVDGVVHGNTRTELTGVDPNRMWKRTMKRLSPGVSAIKKLINQYKQNVKLVLDLHSHSKKLGCFFYGNSLIYDPKSTKIFPTLVCDKDERFQIKNCRFRGGYDTTARSVLFSDLGIKHVYTVQCSLMGYLKKNRITQYKISDYHQMGRKIIQNFIQLEKTKNTKPQTQIFLQLSDKMIDREDAQSARSESSLSDEQYEQIMFKNLIKKKKKKVRKSQNQNITLPIQAPKQENTKQDLKYFVKRNTRGNTRIQISLKKKCHERQLSNKQLHVRNQNIFPMKTENRPNKQNSLKKGGTLGLKQITIPKLPPRKFQQKQTNQNKKMITNFSLTRAKIQSLYSKQDKQKDRTTEKKQAEVQACFIYDQKTVQNRRYNQKQKNDNSLCIVGSSLQDDLVYVFKNQVGVQAYQQLVNQVLSSADGNKRSIKIKKIPKVLNYLCSNLIGVNHQNSVLPQDKRLAPLQTKKPVNTKV